MPLIIATGSNLNDRYNNLLEAKSALSQSFSFIEESRVYLSKAVDYENQPDFYNQVLVFKTPGAEPQEIMTQILKIEATLGRTREVLRGPRTIDIDILFIDNVTSNTDHLTLPHPRLFDRSFVVLPLMELSCFESLTNNYEFKTSFDNFASPLNFD